MSARNEQRSLQEQLAEYVSVHTKDEKVINFQEKKQNRINMKDIKRGQIYWVDYGKNNDSYRGSEQAGGENGMRTCLVISNDIGNNHAPVVVIVPLTSQQKASLPTHISIIANKENGLSKDSIVLCEQPKTIDKNYRVKAYVGKLSEYEMSKVDTAIEISLHVGEAKDDRFTRQAKRIASEIKDIDTSMINSIIKYGRTDSDFFNDKFQERQMKIAELKSYCKKYELEMEKFYQMDIDDNKGQIIRERRINVI
jgi:mRNA interferase MazF